MEFRILGPLELVADGKPLDIGGRKQRALLAHLVLRANRVVSTDELIERLWEDEPPETARKALQVYVSQLRKVVGSERLVTKAPGYILSVPAEKLDLTRFERLRTEGRPHEALELWRGPALAEFTHDRFAQHEIARLEELRLVCVEERIDVDLSAGRHFELVPELEALVSEHPLRERLQRQLMLALHRSGRQAEALEAYRRARSALVEELGIEPSAELRRLEQAILRQDSELDLPPAKTTEPRELPTGTVTFLCTDLEGSTALLKELGADAYAEVIEKMRTALREVFAGHGGREVDTQGDSFLVAFARATDAVAAAVAAQSRLRELRLRVRIGLHTGEPLRTSEGYAGLVVHTAARICAAGHGAQVLLSQATRDLAEVEAKDLGLHRLKDLDAPVRIYQLGHAKFPPLTSRFFSNLPVPATPFLGREREVEHVVGLLHHDDARLVTLVGPGGTGKTRLAIEAAAKAPERFPDGIIWIPLAPLDDPALVFPTVAHSVGVGNTAEASLAETLTNALANKRTLLILDNVEHLLPLAAADVALLADAGAPVVLATSRERLQLQGEHVHSVPTMTEDEAVELFRARAEALGADFDADGAVIEICARLDRLPLALELAAARMTLFTPDQLLERLAKRLDLLKGGRDADTRHQTLRATIEWSHDLLDEDEQRLFRRLSVFAGGCTLEAAEEVCDATVDTLQSLIDKSLLRRREGEFGPRYFMLETIREYAAERLNESGEVEDVSLRHAQWVCELAERVVGLPPERRISDPIAPFPDERDNARRALAWAWTAGEEDLALRFGPACLRYWMTGFYRDAIAWLEPSLRVDATSESRAVDVYRVQGTIAFHILGNTDLAQELWGKALRVAESLGDVERTELLKYFLGGIAWERGDLDRALHLNEDGLARARVRGDRHQEGLYAHLAGEVLRDLGRFEEAEAALLEADGIAREIADDFLLANNLHSLGDLELDRGDLSRAAAYYGETLQIDRKVAGEGPRHTAYCLAGVASVLAERGRDADAATLWGAVCDAEQTLGFGFIPRERRRYERRLARLENSDAWLAGRELTLDEAENLVAPALAAAGY